MVRELDLKKPPSIAESIDWARALLLLGADDIDRRDVHATRCRSSSSTAPTSTSSPSASGSSLPRLPAERRRLAARRRCTRSGDAPPGLAARLARVRRGAARRGRRDRHQRAARRLRGARATSVDRAGRRSARRWPRRWPSRRRTAASSTSSSTASSSAPPSSPAVARGRRARSGGIDADGRRARPRDAAPADRRRRCATATRARMRDLARLAIAAFGRQGEGSGVIGVDVQRIRRALGLRAEPQPDLPPEDPRREGLPRDAAAPLRGAAAPRARARADRAHRVAAARAAAQRARPRAAQRARCRTSPPCTASSRSSSGG